MSKKKFREASMSKIVKKTEGKWVTNPRKQHWASTTLSVSQSNSMIKDPHFSAIFGWLPVN